ncbi:hypothetical protein KCTC32516_01343 [Polaribacter huanghezhanensis]|uniref:hypothetical protein n=1 Tax=Polaribacter huanghezhanensis TaxID=1354726 RepID=UPI00264949D5|nr:hypothetical protein [Polaribacter huanghezhanensis]WKD85993.1 hypothetical protein KCTC32516_01343 [Polaribacter huanghezhanensis]
MGFIKREILIGALVSLFATFSGVFIYIEFFSKVDFQETLSVIKEQDLSGKILTLAAIPNLFVFFIYIKKKQDYRARGVLLTTILIALTTFVVKLF